MQGGELLINNGLSHSPCNWNCLSPRNPKPSPFFLISRPSVQYLLHPPPKVKQPLFGEIFIFNQHEEKVHLGYDRSLKMNLWCEPTRFISTHQASIYIVDLTMDLYFITIGLINNVIPKFNIFRPAKDEDLGLWWNDSNEVTQIQCFVCLKDI